PVLNGYRSVVEGIAGFLILQNGPYYCHNALGFLGYLVQGSLGLFIKGKTVQKVPWWVSGQGELGEKGQVTTGFPGFFQTAGNFRDVPVEIPHGSINLADRDLHLKPFEPRSKRRTQSKPE